MTKKQKELRYLVLDALMVAMYVVLARFMTIQFGNIKITLAALPIIFIAFYLGLSHVCIVAAMAEFLSQMLGYGLTWTTPLWLLPVVVRGILICFFVSVLLKGGKHKTVLDINYVEYFIILLISGFVVTVLNTAVIALDALIFGYYSYAYVFGDLAFRFISMILSTVVYTIITKSVIDVLYKYKY